MLLMFQYPNTNCPTWYASNVPVSEYKPNTWYASHVPVSEYKPSYLICFSCSSIRIHSPVFESQILAVLSQEPDTTRSLCTATHRTWIIQGRKVPNRANVPNLTLIVRFGQKYWNLFTCRGLVFKFLFKNLALIQSMWTIFYFSI